VETTITCLTTAPIVLRGEESQTYRPGHHKFTEEFIFAPVLEPGLPSNVLAELETRGIHLIHAVIDFPGSHVTYYDACGVGHACACGLLFRRGDCDGDGSVGGSVTDALFLLSYNLLGDPEPPAPFSGCGPGITADRLLGCAQPGAGCGG